jgi:hypothetical protein
MSARAARWVDHLFPRVAVRQWVLTVPWPRRWDLARHPVWTRGVLRRLVPAIPEVSDRFQQDYLDQTLTFLSELPGCSRVIAEHDPRRHPAQRPPCRPPAARS